MTDHGRREAPLTFRSSLEEGHPERQQDTLEALPYAEALGEYIRQCETPVFVGLQGAPGTGRTTLLNMLRGSGEADGSGLLDGEDCKVIDFATWTYAQFNRDSDLAIACIHALTGRLGEALEPDDQIEGLQVRSQVSEAQERLESVLRHIHTPMPRGPFPLRGSDGSRDIPPHRDVAARMLDFRREFQALVDYWVGDDTRRRIVIFVDDLDRVRPVEAVVLLEALKNYVDVPGCVFVLAVDDAHVLQGMAERMGSGPGRAGKVFYDKIIQVPFVLPVAGFDFAGYIAGLLAGAGLPCAEELAADPGAGGFFLDISLCSVGRNPRNIKRAMHFTNLLENVRRRTDGEEPTARDVKILYAMACMRIAWPDLYGHFAAGTLTDTVAGLRNRDARDALPETRQWSDRQEEGAAGGDLPGFFAALDRVLDEDATA